MMSVSRGNVQMPCVQAVAISKYGFGSVAREELAAHLFLEPPVIQLQEETREIAAHMKLLYPGEGTDNPLSQLSEEYKQGMLESFIEKKLNKVIKRNVLAYYMVSPDMDFKLCGITCREQ